MKMVRTHSTPTRERTVAADIKAKRSHHVRRRIDPAAAEVSGGTRAPVERDPDSGGWRDLQPTSTPAATGTHSVDAREGVLHRRGVDTVLDGKLAQGRRAACRSMVAPQGSARQIALDPLHSVRVRD